MTLTGLLDGVVTSISPSCSRLTCVRGLWAASVLEVLSPQLTGTNPASNTRGRTRFTNARRRTCVAELFTAMMLSILVHAENELNLVVSAAGTNVTPLLYSVSERKEVVVGKHTSGRAGNLVAMPQHDHRDYADGSGIPGSTIAAVPPCCISRSTDQPPRPERANRRCRCGPAARIDRICADPTSPWTPLASWFPGPR